MTHKKTDPQEILPDDLDAAEGGLRTSRMFTIDPGSGVIAGTSETDPLHPGLEVSETDTMVPNLTISTKTK